jgi:hypothetical protein
MAKKKGGKGRDTGGSAGSDGGRSAGPKKKAKKKK